MISQDACKELCAGIVLVGMENNYKVFHVLHVSCLFSDVRRVLLTFGADSMSYPGSADLQVQMMLHPHHQPSGHHRH